MNKKILIDDIECFERKVTDSGIKYSVVFFGSARIHPETSPKHAHYYDSAQALSFSICSFLMTRMKNPSEWALVTGGGPGIMEAANKGAKSAGITSIGWSISIPYEREQSKAAEREISQQFNYFATRKYALLHNAKIVIIFPGGIGTLDEFFELLVLVKTERMLPPVVILYNSGFWKKLINLDVIIEEGFIEADIKHVFHYSDTVEQAMEVVQRFLGK